MAGRIFGPILLMLPLAICLRAIIIPCLPSLLILPIVLVMRKLTNHTTRITLRSVSISGLGDSWQYIYTNWVYTSSYI